MKLPDFHETDGRRLRSIASRDRIIHAVIELIDQKSEMPSAENIAAQAGVGLRSVFRHFGDMDTLYAAVLERIGRRYLFMLEPYRPGSWQDQLRESLDRRMQLFETGLGFRLAADLYRTGSATVRMGRRTFEEMLRARLESVVPETVRADAIWFEQLDMWLNLDCYASLRERRGMSHSEAAALISVAIEQLIAAKSAAAAA